MEQEADSVIASGHWSAEQVYRDQVERQQEKEEEEEQEEEEEEGGK